MTPHDAGGWCGFKPYQLCMLLAMFTLTSAVIILFRPWWLGASRLLTLLQYYIDMVDRADVAMGL